MPTTTTTGEEDQFSAEAHECSESSASPRTSESHHERLEPGITGARWSLEGAQAMLWLRAIYASGAHDAYWDYHIQQEHQRKRLSRYASTLRPPRMTLTLREPHPLK